MSWLLSQFIAKSMAKNYSDGYWFSLETENWKCIIKKSRVLSSCLFPIRAKSKFVCVSGKPRQVKTAELQMSRWWWLFLRHEIIPSVNTKHSNANIFINNSQAGTQPGTLGLIEQLNNNDVSNISKLSAEVLFSQQIQIKFCCQRSVFYRSEI